MNPEKIQRIVSMWLVETESAEGCLKSFSKLSREKSFYMLCEKEDVCYLPNSAKRGDLLQRE